MPFLNEYVFMKLMAQPKSLEDKSYISRVGFTGKKLVVMLPQVHVICRALLKNGYFHVEILLIYVWYGDHQNVSVK